jgi:hypothetical protein
MEKILNDIIEAHGGIQKWRQFNKIEAKIVGGGKLFELKGLPMDDSQRQMTVWLHEQKSSVYPFGSPDYKALYSPERVAIETLNGAVIAERSGNPDEIHEHVKALQWDPLDLAYFNGYALYTYLTTPFFLLTPGFEIKEIDPWQEGDEIWKGLSVTFPSHITTHSKVQNFYFGKDNLIRRHDYHIDIAGNFQATQYISDLQKVQGIMIPAKRRAYKMDSNGNPILTELMATIDLSGFHLS